jgi:hypothetical protein
MALNLCRARVGSGVEGPLTATLPPAYDKNMKHVPEAHQHVAPDLTISLILAGVVAVMIVVYVVVAWAK